MVQRCLARLPQAGLFVEEDNQAKQDAVNLFFDPVEFHDGRSMPYYGPDSDELRLRVARDSHGLHLALRHRLRCLSALRHRHTPLKDYPPPCSAAEGRLVAFLPPDRIVWSLFLHIKKLGLFLKQCQCLSGYVLYEERDYDLRTGALFSH